MICWQFYFSYVIFISYELLHVVCVCRLFLKGFVRPLFWSEKTSR